MGTEGQPGRDSPLHVIRLHHAQITIPVGAEDAARRFYCGVLGLAEIAKPATLAGRGGFWLHVGEMQLHVGTEDGVDRPATKAHLAYEVTELALWRERLTSAGCATFEGVPIPGYDRFEARDPFGNRIEFISRAE
jgi:catechol 2,3-dioxygenase-like lactoylglutathione lyase family enzyme